MDTQEEKQDTVRSSAYNPFPEPQTIPSGWDTSAFISTHQSDESAPSEDREERDLQ